MWGVDFVVNYSPQAMQSISEQMGLHRNFMVHFQTQLNEQFKKYESKSMDRTTTSVQIVYDVMPLCSTRLILISLHTDQSIPRVVITFLLLSIIWRTSHSTSMGVLLPV